MEEMELKRLWQACDQKLERSLALNLHLVRAIQTQKAKSEIRSMRGIKVFTLLAGILWVLCLGFLVVNSLSFQRIFFVVSAGMIMVFNIIAIAVYIRHLLLMSQIDNSESVVHTQKQLAALQASTLRITGILFLQAPFYTTFWWMPGMVEDVRFWLISVPVTGVFTYGAIWMYRNISYKNVGKRWFQRLFSGKEWSAVEKAREFLKEIDAFERGV
jgi:hypothetical protein